MHLHLHKVRIQRVTNRIPNLKAQATEEMTNLLKLLKFQEHLKKAHNRLPSEGHQKKGHQNSPDAEEKGRAHTDGEIYLLVSPRDEPEDSNPSHCLAHSLCLTGGTTLFLQSTS
jgi:hypothetical protein